MSKKVVIVGAGLGGLAAAIRLAERGFAVTVLEKNSIVGGKVNLIKTNNYSFDTGASLLTMPDVFRELFTAAGRKLEDYLRLVRLDPICRYFWTDGTRFDACADLQKCEAEIARIAPSDAKNFRNFLADSRRKFEIAERTFLKYSLNDLPRLLSLRYARDLLAISSFKTLAAHNRKYFKSPKLQQLFNRFATYNGSSPFQTPATFALIPFVEFGLGAWYVSGGIYKIPEALARLARELKVEIETNAEVEKIIIKNARACAVRLKSGAELAADFVVSNADAIETYRSLIAQENRKSFSNQKLSKIEPSCSGFVLLIGAKKKFPLLAHHNIFFSDDSRAEFDAIFGEKRPATNPTVYVCAASRTDETQAPTDCENLFVLVNAPYTSAAINWAKEAAAYRRLIIEKLENFGLTDLEKSIEVEQIITPEDFETKYRANRGSIYGVSSNGIFSAFVRPPNQSAEIRNLFFVGGATHPGGGMPLVLLSAKMTAELIEREQINNQNS
jgi:phytoene desaturase